MEAYILDWLSLFFRWFHVIVGIAWIGASFYFVWLDNSLESPSDWKRTKGIKGDLWAIHGGGFYEVAKYKLGPEKLPETLHWFKWEAYTTWLTGIVLLSIVYYSHAQTYMTGPLSWINSPALSIVAGLSFLLVSVIVYEILFRMSVVNKGLYFALLILIVFGFLSWLAFQLFSSRAAFIHIGAAIGSIMVANVFLGIIPAQVAFVKAIKAGTLPDQALANKARLRSVHNNYFTLPAIFIMISNHYSFVFSNEYGWLWLIAICAIAAYARHYFNLRNQGTSKPVILITALLALVVLAFIMMPASLRNSTISTGSVSQQAVTAIIQTRCSGCHALKPLQPGFVAAPAGVLLESTEQLLKEKDRVLKVAVYSHYMPLGNITQMTDVERDELAAWLKDK